jgi:glutamate racemase
MVTAATGPIGIFDSGIGGLTVTREIIRRLPDERVLYFGDTARVPYGPKSPDTVRRYSREIGAFLSDQGVKAIVIACNTATAHALDDLRAQLAVPIIGVVEPGARAAVNATRTGRVGVIGTAGTIRSGAYERALTAAMPGIRVFARACPLFVPLVEEGWTDHPATRSIAEEYLAPLRAENIDTLVLGCTHYPLLRPLIARMLGSDVQLIDSAAETAAEIARVIAERGIGAVPGASTAHRFVASDDPAQFLRLGQRFLGTALNHVEVRTFG